MGQYFNPRVHPRAGGRPLSAARLLTAKGDLIKVPELMAKVTGSGNERVIDVTVSNDVDVVAASWRTELLSVLSSGQMCQNFSPKQ